MDMNKFANEVAKRVQEILGEEYEASVTEKNLTNGGIQKQITVGKKDSKIRPAVNLDAVIMEEADVEKVAGRVVEIARNSKDADIDPTCLSDKDYILQNCYLEMVNKRNNKSLAEEAVHEDFLDLIAIVRCNVSIRNSEKGSFVVKNCIAKQAGLDEGVLIEAAKKNMKDDFHFQGMSEVMVEMLGTGSPFGDVIPFEEEIMFVGSNDSKIHGASILMFSEKFQELAERLNDDLYIIPSSIHEIIAVPASKADKEEVAAMIPQVNTTEVADNEVLADTLYFFDREIGEIKVA